jgi:glycosyltransferase involved in cell wall biosynthesis
MDADTLAASWSGADDPNRPIAFLVTAPVKPGDLPGRLGHADYSYGFVLQALVPVLERVGSWRLVPRPESSLVYAAARAAADGFRPIHLSLCPLQAAYLTPAVPTILFPFWEFPRIPDRDFGFDTRQNWGRLARSADLLLTACRLTADAFQRAGVGVPVGIVPVPVAPESFLVPDWHPEHIWTLSCRHIAWGGATSAAACRDGAVPDLREAMPLRGLPRLERGLRRRYHRYVRPWLSDRAALRLRRLKNAVLRKMEAPPPPRIEPTPLTLTGLVYTSVFNLGDPRKNPRDLLSAFLLAFRDRPDVTLVLKLAASPVTELIELERISALYYGLGIEHRCRVVVITDYLSEADMERLYRSTTYYVNTSHAEGACLPLQRALAAGRPGIAPVHTAMADYLDESAGFVVASHPEPAPWPHDPEQRCETTWHRLVWADLHDQFVRSARIAESDPAAYRALAAEGRRRMGRFASRDAATAALRQALGRMRVRRKPGAVDWAA